MKRGFKGEIIKRGCTTGPNNVQERLGWNKNVTHKIPSVDEILMLCDRETESWK
jgi:hypothetical protein